MNFIRYLKLPFHFEVLPLQKDLTSVLSEPWTSHGNRWIYTGEWSGLALRNANMAHSVANRGQTDRIHLVIDCGVNDWLRRIFEANNEANNKANNDVK